MNRKNPTVDTKGSDVDGLECKKPLKSHRGETEK